MLSRLFKRSYLAQAIAQNDLKLLLKAIRAGEALDQPFSLPDQTETEHTALKWLLIRQQPELLQKLLEAGSPLPHSSVDTAELLCLGLNADKQALALLDALLQAGADPNADNARALFACLELDDCNQIMLLINRLLQYGADLNRPDEQQGSLLARLLQQPRPLEQAQQLTGALIQSGAELPDDLDQLSCSETLKQFARRQAQDLAIRRQFSS